MAACEGSAGRLVYAASAPDTPLCMSTFLDYVFTPSAMTNSRSPEAFALLSWVGSGIFCVTIAWLHWEAWQARKAV